MTDRYYSRWPVLHRILRQCSGQQLLTYHNVMRLTGCDRSNAGARLTWLWRLALVRPGLVRGHWHPTRKYAKALQTFDRMAEAESQINL